MRIELLQTCIWCEKPVKNFGQTAMTCSEKCKEELNKLLEKNTKKYLKSKEA